MEDIETRQESILSRLKDLHGRVSAVRKDLDPKPVQCQNDTEVSDIRTLSQLFKSYRFLSFFLIFRLPVLNLGDSARGGGRRLGVSERDQSPTPVSPLKHDRRAEIDHYKAQSLAESRPASSIQSGK